MNFNFTSNNLVGRERQLQRLFEILPGLVSWTILIGMTLLAFLKPLIAAVIIIAFYLYWLLKLFYMTIFLVLSYLRLSIEGKTNWMEKVQRLDPKEICHLIIVPIVKEAKEVVEPGLVSFANGSFPAKQVLVVLALEERAEEKIKKDIKELAEKYKDKFLNCFITIHPDNLEGEARVKGANTTFAAKKAAEYFREKNMPFGNITISCFDADTVATPEYFAALTYYFIMCPERTRASFQPIPVYNNNIWDAPGITRVLDVGSSFFQLIEATNPESLVTFSSHSMSFKALVEIGFWPKDMISDDSAIFWKAFIHYNGDYRVIPMYTTLSMDTVAADTLWKTVINVYKQKRRWAWGVENFPIVARGFLRNKKILFISKIRAISKLFEGHISWATWGFLLTIIGWLPAIFAKGEFSRSVLYYSTPRIATTIFHLASISLITSIILTLLLLPKRRMKYTILKKLGFVLEWLLIPLTFLFLNAVPALDAQTRLMFARYMTFWVTDKEKLKIKNEK